MFICTCLCVCMYIHKHFVYPFIFQYLFLPFYYHEYSCYEHRYTKVCSSSCFQFFGYIPRSVIAGLYGNAMFNFLRNYYHSGCTILHSHSAEGCQIRPSNEGYIISLT